MALKVLNNYGGVGGNRKLWTGCEVTCVEKDEKIANVYAKQYPKDKIIIGDAHDYLLNNYSLFDFIWSSPPCQSHTRMIRSGRNRKPRYPDMKLYEEILFLKHNFKGKWVVENVIAYYEMFMYPKIVGRHALWANFDFIVEQVEQPKDFINLKTVAGKKKLQDWLGIYFDENLYYENNHCLVQVLRNCVHPIIGNQIFEQAFL